MATCAITRGSGGDLHKLGDSYSTFQDSLAQPNKTQWHTVEAQEQLQEPREHLQNTDYLGLLHVDPQGLASPSEMLLNASILLQPDCPHILCVGNTIKGNRGVPTSLSGP